MAILMQIVAVCVMTQMNYLNKVFGSLQHCHCEPIVLCDVHCFDSAGFYDFISGKL